MLFQAVNMRYDCDSTQLLQDPAEFRFWGPRGKFRAKPDPRLRLDSQSGARLLRWISAYPNIS